jgi:hypothetical protein
MAIACTRADQVTEWLDRTGIVIKGQHASRVILDIEVGKPIKVFVEQFGDSRIFSVGPPDCTHAEVLIASHLPPPPEAT